MLDPDGKLSRYANPIRPYDLPDPDVIRLSSGGFALVASSFDRRPGLPLWHSWDLVDWVPVGFAGGFAPLIEPSGGVWAPALREHDGHLWITWADPDRGVFVVDAPDLTGPWSSPRLVLAGPGPIDPCPFWDEDGRTWIVHGWARSRAGFANRLDIVEMDTDLTRIVSPRRVLIDGDAIDGCTVLEGPKLYRRGTDYWLFAPAGGVENGWQYAFRATSLEASWSHRIVLDQGSTAVNGPHQGAWVRDASGDDWFVHFQHTPLYGRVLHLQPMAWADDGWPLLGAAVGGGAAEPVRGWSRPAVDRSATSAGASPTRRRVPALEWGGIANAWHARGADPNDLITTSSGDGITLRPGGRVAQPLDARASRVEVTLLIGTGEVALIGDRNHVLRVGPAAHAEVARDEAPTDHVTAVECELPVRIGVEIAGAAARYLIAGQPAGGWFPLRPSRWTGMEFGLGAASGRSSRFEAITVTLGEP